MNNRKMGNSFEQELCKILSNYGFWAHNLKQDNSGQPADVIAVRNKVPYLIDAKVCSNNKFPLSRIEENQHLAMDMWEMCGNGVGWFALKLENQIYMLSYYILDNTRSLTLSADDICSVGIPIEKWVTKCK